MSALHVQYILVLNREEEFLSEHLSDVKKLSFDIGSVTAKEFISMWKNSTYRQFLPNGCIVTLPRFQVRVNSAHKINIYHTSNFSRRY